MPLQKCNCSSRGKSIQSQRWGPPSLLSPLWEMGHFHHPNYVIPLGEMIESWVEGRGHVLACILISSSNSLSLFSPPRCKKFAVLSQGWNMDFESYQHLIFASKRLLTVHSNSTEVANQNRYWLGRAKVKETLGEGFGCWCKPWVTPFTKVHLPVACLGGSGSPSCPQCSGWVEEKQLH